MAYELPTSGTAPNKVADKDLHDAAVNTAIDAAKAAAQARSSHTGEQSISTVTGLQSVLDGKAQTADGITSSERTKLAGVATGATANAADADLRARSTHTGTQTIETVSGLATTLDNLDAGVIASTSHIADTANPHAVTKAQVGLGDVDNVSAGAIRDRSTHTGAQAIETVTGLQTALDAARQSGGASSRPGEDSQAFITSAVGEPESGTAIEGAAGVTFPTLADMGRVALVTNQARVIAPRRSVKVYANRVYMALYAVRRTVDTNDPSGDTIRLGLRTLASDYSAIGSPVVVQDRALLVSHGIWVRAATFSAGTPDIGDAEIELSTSAVQVRPFVEIFGATTSTAIADIVAMDVTEAAQIEGALDVLVIEAARAATEAARDQTIPAAEAAVAAAISAVAAAISAESARDSAFSNADVFVDTSEGLASTSIGDQFQVASGDQVIRYLHESGPVATEVSRLTNATGFERERAGRLSEVAGARLAISGGENRPIAISPDGRSDLWQTSEGIDGRFASPGTARVPVTAGRLPLFVGQSGDELIGFKDGSVYLPGDLVKPDVFLQEALGNQQVFVRSVDPDTLETQTEQVTFSQQGDFEAIAVTDSGLIRAATQHDLVYERGAVGWRERIGTAGKLRVLIVHGQSNAVGAQSGIVETVPLEVITGLAPIPGRLLIFNGGVMPHQDGVSAAVREVPIDAAQYASVVDAREGVGFTLRESMAMGASEVIAGPWGFADPVLVFNCGHGASGFYTLVENGFGVKQVPWENIETLVAAAEAYASSQSLQVEIVGLIYNQGESDQDRSAAVWANMMAALRTRTDALATSIGQSTPIPLILCQVGAPRTSTGLASAATVGAEIASRTLPHTYCAPLYFSEIGDYATVHYPSSQHRHIGEYCGKIIADVWHGVDRTHLHAVSADRIGRTVQIEMSEPVIVDMFGVIDPGTVGIRYQDSTGSIGISAVRAVGNALQVTLLATPSGTDEVISIACDNAKNYPAEEGFYGLGRRFGQRSCIRAVQPRGWSQTTARPFWEWASHQRINVTA